MKQSEFLKSLAQPEAPEGLSIELKALWLDKRGEWALAHDLVNDLTYKNACRVHAYLHRAEGDNWNANYWYRRAGTRMPVQSLLEEWESLVNEWTDRN